MANRLIDTQVAQNSSTTGSIGIPLTAAPVLFGTLGLNTAAAGPDLQVQYTATATVSSTLAVVAPVVVSIFRVVSGVSTPIFSLTETVPIGTLALATVSLSVNGIDFQPPNPGFIVYQAFISAPGLVLFPTRVGPESFRAVAYSD